MHKILVIDDDDNILNVIRILLELNDFIVSTLHKWDECYNKVLDFNPDLILLDISLDGENGKSICAQLKSNNSTKHMVIILFLALRYFDKITTESEANHFIGKPFELKDLLEKINYSINKLSA